MRPTRYMSTYEASSAPYMRMTASLTSSSAAGTVQTGEAASVIGWHPEVLVPSDPEFVWCGVWGRVSQTTVKIFTDR